MIFIKQVKEEDLNLDYLDRQQRELAASEKKLKEKKAASEKLNRILETLENEIQKTLMGESDFDSKNLNNLIQKNELDKERIKEEIKQIEDLYENQKLNLSDTTNNKRAIIKWEEEFVKADEEEKKVLLSKLIKKIVVKKDDIEIEMNPFLQRFITLD